MSFRIEDCEILSIEDVSCEDEYVYNLEVEDNHNYFANDLLVSNCHSWRKEAANCLLKILEEPPTSTMFILATTEPQQIIPTIKSRCQRFDLKKILQKDMVPYLEMICDKEGIKKVSKNALVMIARSAGGKARDAVTMLESVISRCGSEITDGETAEVIGIPDQKSMCDLLGAILKGNYKDSILAIKKAINSGSSPETVFYNFQKYCHDMLVARCVGGYDFLYINEDIKEIWIKQMENTHPVVFSRIIDQISHFTSNLNYNPNPEASLDACVVEIINLLKKQKQKSR